jgi:hypothetical protein
VLAPPPTTAALASAVRVEEGVEHALLEPPLGGAALGAVLRRPVVDDAGGWCVGVIGLGWCGVALSGGIGGE